MMQYVLLCLAFCKTHPAAVTMVVGAGASCFVKKFDKYPRVHALFEVLAHAGVNLPGVVSAVSRLLTGAPKAAAVALVLLVGWGAGGCGAMTAQDRGDVASYEAQQDACIAANPGNKAAIDACRAAVKADWCAKWAARFDAGVCQ